MTQISEIFFNVIFVIRISVQWSVGINENFDWCGIQGVCNICPNMSNFKFIILSLKNICNFPTFNIYKKIHQYSQSFRSIWLILYFVVFSQSQWNLSRRKFVNYGYHTLNKYLCMDYIEVKGGSLNTFGYYGDCVLLRLKNTGIEYLIIYLE